MGDTSGSVPVIYPIAGKRIWVAGHRGMVGSARTRRLEREPCELLTATRQECDLGRQDQVERWMGKARPQAVIVAAARVGGILANDRYPAEFLYDNLMIEANVIHTARRVQVEKLLFLGSSCIYPKHAPQPMPEECLLTGPLEPTNQWYAIAKIAGISLCQSFRRQYGCNFIAAMPTNLYGVGDHFDLEHSHVMPALIRKFHDAKLRGERQVTVWGTGAARREFLNVDDLADACLFLMRHYDGLEHVNVGTGEDISIRELADILRAVIYPEARVVFDTSKPDGTPRRLLDVTRIRDLGWRHTIGLEDGIRRTYDWFVEHYAAAAAEER